MHDPALGRGHSRNSSKTPQSHKLLSLFAAILAVSAAAALCSCAGYTAAGPGTAATGALTASSSSLDFGNVDVGSNATQSVSFTNTGTAPIDISGMTVSGTDFSLAAGSVPVSIPVGQSISVQLDFAPRNAGRDTGALTLTSDASTASVASSAVTSTVTAAAKGKSNFKVSLQGNATQAGIRMSPSPVNFSGVTVGQTSTQVVQLTNNGTSNLQLKSATISGAGFAMSGLTLPVTIPVGQSASFSVQFTPVSASTFSGNISFSDNAPATPQTLALTGSAIAVTSQLSANPSSLAFGNVQVGSSDSLGATFTNTGNSDVTISNVAVSGTGYSASGITSGLILSPGQSASLSVTFAPTGLGNATGNVSIASNAANSPATLSLTGESHAVSLSWTPSTSTGLSGYNVYRGTASGAYGATPVNSSPVSGANYTDSSISASQTYFYVVKAVASGVESANSNEVSAAIP
jgi:HYDIN/CFA65/VesB family protein/ASPM-SPD-2-Hydin domain-containing protein